MVVVQEDNVMILARWGWVLVAALLLSDCRQVWARGNGPDATVRQAYAITAREIAGNGKGEPPWRPPYRDSLMSEKLAALFPRDDQYMEESGDEDDIGSDPFISGQAGDIKKLRITVGSRRGDAATVFADFVSLGDRVRVEFAMVRQDERWVIDDITDAMEKATFSRSPMTAGRS
jgi:hypothetical protein